MLEFIGDGAIKIAEDKNIFGDIRTRVGNTGTVIYEGDRQLQEQIGAGNAKLKSIQFSTAGANIQLSTNNIHAMNLSLLDAGQTLTVDDNINFAGKIRGRGTVDFAGRSTVAQIGEINARVARVRAGVGNVDFNQPIYADIVEINGNSPVRIIDRTLSTNHILLNHQHARITIVNGFAAPVAILAAAPGHGHVIFAANGNVGAIGQNGTPVGTTEFRNNAQHNLSGDIYTNNIIFDNGVFTPQNQNIQIVVPQGGINNIPAGWQYVQGALIANARAQQLVQPPVNQHQQPIQLVNRNRQPEPEAEIVDNQRQELRQNEQNELQQLELEVNNDRPVLQQQPLEVVDNQHQEVVINEQNRQENRIIDIEQPVPQVHYTQIDAEVQQQRVVQIKESLIQATSTIIDTNSNTVEQQDRTTKNLVSQLTTPVIQNHKNVEDPIKQLNNMGVTFDKAEVEIAKLDAAVTPKTREQQALLYVVGMTILSPEERTTTINRMEQAVQAHIKVAEQVTETIHHTIDNRMNELSNQPEIMVSSGLGVAAGDETKRKLQGVWARGIYGVSKQQADKGSAGYNGNSAGGTIGGDFELNEKNIVGIAYSNIRSGFKYKQSRAGDKTTGNSHILSLYGAHQLNDSLSLKTMLAAGMSKITTKRLIMDKIATGKVKNKSYSAEASLNYKIMANENLYFMPNVGLRYAHYRDGAYSERGVGVYNVSVAAKSNNTLTAITGINMIMPQKLSEALIVVPSVHVAIESYLLNKKQKVKAKLAWMDSYFENNASLGAKSAKFSYNVGGGIVAKYNNIEVSANYNCNLRKKYQNHQGTVKLKILF
ncbi:Sca family autotransporter beta-domain protein [Candidatus Trichorickettsia mobilis]|uniref:Sca family autotransporter beta-domain protein n=1 Tax=Candidatus Trichorickettsia mobilis TaxID=1346319 RepID=A0ABZ0UXK7_9RICK|nr:autotransporter domain-containing protein [Candidatus Trichorickettsia mobilis]WPY00809.1 Sca family autotransporter beta-domain protein [Candidatus Trichorickettsia mobilis]